MAITYPNFLTQVRSYAEVDSNVLSDTLIDQFIRHTELDVAGKVDYDDIRKYATSNFNANKKFLTMPSAFLVIRSLQVFASSSLSSARTYMEKKDTSFISEFNGSGATGQPKYYANWDANFWVVAPTPDATYEITLAYVKQPTSLTDASVSGSGTYISNKYQDLLLYAALVEAYGYLKGPADMLQYYEQSFQRAIQSYAVEQQGRRRRDEYNDGVIRTPLKSESPSKY